MTTEWKSAQLLAASKDALQTRERILTEAERLFRVYGYTKTTVADIAEATRMSPANVYRFFATKSDINNAICERVIAKGEFRPQDAPRSAECVTAAMAPMLHPMMLAQCMDVPQKATPAEMADFIIA